jgi:hypothetical protein
MVVLDKYKNDGWGLSRKEFEILLEYLNAKKGLVFSGELNIVEFGSGRSTEFLIDAMKGLDYKVNIFSFDDSPEYAFKGTHPNLKLNIVPLVECSDDNFNKMFNEKKYDQNLMPLKNTAVHTRQKNTFYKVEDSMLPEKIDLMIVDGPHGNGRSLAFLRCFDRLRFGSMVLIDDASHYPFHHHLSLLNENIVLHKQHLKGNKWDTGGDFVFCCIVN